MSGKLFKFGVFELNTSTRQVYKQGRRIRLQEQPLRALEVLLENPGGLVSRSELREKLWPSDIHVDFELGLTGAMKRLRIALSDSADNPRFIETVPKAGYRFIAPVQVLSFPEGAQDSPDSQATPTAAGAAAARAPEPVGKIESPSSRAGMLLALALAVLLCAAAYALRPISPPLAISEVTKLSTSGRAWPQENLLSDGPRLYYTEFSVSGGFRLRQILLNGNENSDTAIPADLLVRTISPDRTTFLAISLSAAQADTPSPVWVIPTIGGSPRRIGNLQSNDFDWSSDGKLLTFARGGQLFVAAINGSAEHLVSTVAGRVICPRWSPDGRRIRFTVIGQKNESAIWETQADGRDLHPLRLNWPGTPMEGYGDWTQDGRYFVFTSRRQGVSNLWALEEETDWWHRRRTEPVQLSAGPISYARPLPSLDGRIIFAIGTEPGGELVSTKSGGSFAPFVNGASIEHLEFSRDGDWVAYVSFPEGVLWRARKDGGGELQLTFGHLRAAHPHWSPDGKRIMFIGREPGSPARIYSISMDGGNPEPVVPTDARAQTDATWSQDGSQLIFGRDYFFPTQDLALYRYDTRSKQLERIPGTDGLCAPSYSPDGRYLIAQLASVQREIAIIDLKTNSRTTLISGAAEFPTFSPDSKYVYFTRWDREKSTMFRVRVSDKSEEKLFDIPFKMIGSFGTWSGLAPDGSILMLRDRGQTDVYALRVQR